MDGSKNIKKGIQINIYKKQTYQIIYTRWFSQILEDVIKRGKQMRYWRLKGKIKTIQTFHASNFIKWI